MSPQNEIISSAVGAPGYLQVLNKVCFTTCIVCTVLGTVLSLAMIWGEIDGSGFVWKSWLTIGVFFFSSATTLAVSKTLGRS